MDEVSYGVLIDIVVSNDSFKWHCLVVIRVSEITNHNNLLSQVKKKKFLSQTP